MFELATRLWRMSPQIATVSALDPAQPPPDGQRVEQGLGRMLAAAVAGIDHRAVHHSATSAAAPSASWRMTRMSGRIALRVSAVSIRLSPLRTLDAAGWKLETCAPSLLPAISNEKSVRV